MEESNNNEETIMVPNLSEQESQFNDNNQAIMNPTIIQEPEEAHQIISEVVDIPEAQLNNQDMFGEQITDVVSNLYNQAAGKLHTFLKNESYRKL